MHVFCHQTDECFTKDLLSNLSVPMSEKKLMQGEDFEILMQVGKAKHKAKKKDLEIKYTFSNFTWLFLITSNLSH